MTQRIEDCLRHSAAVHADRTAVVCGSQRLTYAQFHEACTVRAKELARKGMQAGDIVPVRACPTIAYLTEYFAIHLCGGIAVPLAKDLPDSEFARYCKDTEGIKAHPDAADILFTTGTTGQSKGVVIGHDAVMADTDNLVCAHGYTPDLDFIICGPLNHCGCWSKVLPCIAQGATIVLMDGIKNLDGFFNAVEQAPGKVATFMVPSSLKIVMQFGADRLAAAASKVAFIETGGAAMTESDMTRLRNLLPSSRLYNTYASTESGIVATYNFGQGYGLPRSGCVGSSMKHSSVSVTPDGQICCGGKTLMLGYLGDAALTERVMKDGMLRMSDTGRIDGDGMLWVGSRNDDVICTGAYKVAPTEVEEEALALPGLRDCICIAEPHPVLGTALKLLYVVEDGETVSKRDIAMHLKARLEPHKVPLSYEATERINMTYNGKKDRKSYRKT